MPSLTARFAPLTLHVIYDYTLQELPIARAIFVDPFVDINASWLRMESGEGISMEASTGGLTLIRTAQRIGPLTFRALVTST